MWGQVKRHKGRMGGSEHTKDREIHGEDEETWTRLSTIVRFGWMPKDKGAGEKNGRTFVSNVNYSDFSKCLISRVRVA